MQDCKVNILGTEYKIEKHNSMEDKDLKPSNKMGYCFYDEHLIVYSDLSTDDDWKNESKEAIGNREKITIRHKCFMRFYLRAGWLKILMKLKRGLQMRRWLIGLQSSLPKSSRYFKNWIFCKAVMA